MNDSIYSSSNRNQYTHLVSKIKSIMHPHTPLVSVLIPAYNAGPYIAQAIQSILDQTHTHRECIIIDDCSTDSTWEIIQHYASQDHRIIPLQNDHNLWIAWNRNKLLSLAQWEYIMRQDADDISYDYRMQKQLEHMLHDPDVWIVWWTLEIFDENGIIWERIYSNNPIPIIYNMSKLGKFLMWREEWENAYHTIKRDVFDILPQDHKVKFVIDRGVIMSPWYADATIVRLIKEYPDTVYIDKNSSYAVKKVFETLELTNDMVILYS